MGLTLARRRIGRLPGSPEGPTPSVKLSKRSFALQAALAVVLLFLVGRPRLPRDLATRPPRRAARAGDREDASRAFDGQVLLTYFVSGRTRCRRR